MAKHKSKQKKQKAERRRQQKRSERSARKARPRGPAGPADAYDDLLEPAVRLPSLALPAPERSFPPIHLDSAGRVVDDPHAALAIDRGANHQAIVAAWRRQILEHPPERDPEGARRLQEARERLLDPNKVIERELGVIHAPDPAAYGLTPRARTVDAKIPALHRAVGQLALYALLEDLIAEPAAVAPSTAAQMHLLGDAGESLPR